MSELNTFLDDLKERVPIETVVAQKVQLTRKGNRYWGLCPFHAEKTPSFTVNPSRNSFKCFGCGQGGDAITFVRETEGLEFFEALRVLADMAGMQMPQKFRGGRPEERGEREQAREALQWARKFFSEHLTSPDAADARKYLLDRSIPESCWQDFGIGWAPRGRQELLGFLRRQKIEDKAIVAAGLAIEDERTQQLKARFWERLMFPVADAGNRTLGFGGRYLPGSFAEEKQLGKYVNSPEGPLFPKRRLLYGIEKLQQGLRDKPEAPVVITEGYLDVIQLHRAGLNPVLAALGTAFTEDHARRLARTERKIVLLLDPDVAGRKAAARAARLLVAEGVDVRVAELPDGHDPADMVAEGRLEELSSAIADSWDILRWRLETWSQKADLSVPAVVHQAASEMAEWIATTPSPVVAEAWANQVQQVLGVSQGALGKLVSPGSPTPVGPTGGGGYPETQESQSSVSPEEVLRRNEREVIAAVLHDPSAYPRFRRELDTIELQDSVARSVLSWCRQQRESGQGFDLASALLAFHDQEPSQWLDRVRLTRPTDPCLALERALDALPGNREQASAAAPDQQVDTEQLRSFLRRISISPND
ncbi:MAG: DNA primase [Planctomycetota bacterium]